MFFFFFWPYSKSLNRHYNISSLFSVLQHNFVVISTHYVQISCQFTAFPRGRFSWGFHSKATLRGSFSSRHRIWSNHWILRPSMKSVAGVIISRSFLLYLFRQLSVFASNRRFGCRFFAIPSFRNVLLCRPRCRPSFTTTYQCGFYNWHKTISFLDLFDGILESRNFNSD